MGQAKTTGMGLMNRVASIATGERPEERFARLLAMRDPGLVRMRDELVPAMLKHRTSIGSGEWRRFDFEGVLIRFQANMDRIRDRNVWKARLDVSSPGREKIRLHTAGFAKRDEITMAPIIRPCGAFGGPIAGDAAQIREAIASVSDIVDRFAIKYLSTRFEKWRELMDGEYAPGRDDIIHDRSTIPERWIPEVDREFDKVQAAYGHAVIGLNEAGLDAAGIQALRDRMEELMNERRPMLEQHYRDRGRDMNMRPLPYQGSLARTDPEDTPSPC